MKYTTPYLHVPFVKIVNPLQPKVGRMKCVTVSVQSVYRHSDFAHVSRGFLSKNALKIDSTSSHTAKAKSSDLLQLFRFLLIFKMDKLSQMVEDKASSSNID